jgi:hypothetical protein
MEPEPLFLDEINTWFSHDGGARQPKGWWKALHEQSRERRFPCGGKTRSGDRSNAQWD